MNSDKGDDLPSSGTIFPYSEGLWSTLSFVIQVTQLGFSWLVECYLDIWFMESGLWNTMLGRSLLMIYFSLAIAISFFVLAKMSKEDIALRNKF
jgi:hypothetical protein